MALDYNFCKTGVSDICDKFYIDDKTVYNNVVGENRIDSAHYLIGFDYVVNGDDVEIENILNDDPLNAIQWEIPSSRDGYSYFDMIIARNWVNITPYWIGDIIYENTKYWKAIQDNNNQKPTDTADVYWEEVPPEDLINYRDIQNSQAQNVVDVERFDIINLCRAFICYGEVTTNAAENCCDDCLDQNNKDFIRVDVLVQAASILTGQLKYVEAHKVAALLADVCNDLSDCGCS